MKIDAAAVLVPLTCSCSWHASLQAAPAATVTPATPLQTESSCVCCCTHALHLKHMECSSSNMQVQDGKEGPACNQKSSHSEEPAPHVSNKESLLCGPTGSQHGSDAEHITGALMNGLSLVTAHGPAPTFRFWVDEVLWSQGYPAVQLLEEVLCQAGGVRAGGPQGKAAAAAAARDPLGLQLGHAHVKDWDLLWTKSTYALKAVPQMRPGQCVSMVVGLNSLTMKKRMLQTLKAAYGPAAAAQITPLSFALPEELPQWKAYRQMQQQQHSRQQQEAGNLQQAGNTQQQQQQQQQQEAVEELWMLKTGQDAGKGLLLLPLSQAIVVAENEAATRDPRQPHHHHLQVAQLYLTRPLLLEDRKMHLRLWLVVTTHQPVQAFLHKRGLVLFSSELYDAHAPWVSTAAAGQHDRHKVKAPVGRQHTADRPTNQHSKGGKLANIQGSQREGHHDSSPSSMAALPIMPLDASTQSSGTVYSGGGGKGSKAKGSGGSVNASSADSASSTSTQAHNSDSGTNCSSGSQVSNGNGHACDTNGGVSCAGHRDAAKGGTGPSTQSDLVETKSAPPGLKQRRLAPGHVTNLARNSSGMVWSLQQLEARLGKATYQQLWSAVQRLLRLTLMAAHGPLQEAHAWLKPPFPEYGFQLLGMDFLVDEQMRPWLLEANSSPSIMALHDDPSTATLVYHEKHQMLTDMFNLIAHRVYAPGSNIHTCTPPPLGEFVDLFAASAANMLAGNKS